MFGLEKIADSFDEIYESSQRAVTDPFVNVSVGGVK